MDLPFVPGSVTLAFCYNRTVEGPFMQSVMRFAQSKWGDLVFGPQGGGTVSMASGPRIASARNELVRNFLKGRGEWMWMVDTDHTFAEDALAKLLEFADPASAPVVGGLCYAGGRGGFVSPTLYRFNEDGSKKALVIPKGCKEPVQVNGTGAAFLLVHRFTLEAMETAYGHLGPHVWFAEGVNAETGEEIGEDVFFCVRAQKGAQSRIYVHCGVEAPHIKNYIIDSEDSKEYEENLSKWGTEVLQAKHLGKLEGRVGSLDYWAEQLGLEQTPVLNREQRRAQQKKAR